VKIISEDSKLLNEIYNDLKRKKVESEKNFKKIDGAMGDVTSYYNTPRKTNNF